MQKGTRNVLIATFVALALAGTLVWAVISVKMDADRYKSETQIRELVSAAFGYAQSHDDNFPPSITALMAASPTLRPETAVSPLATDKRIPSYEMVAPAKPLGQILTESHTPMIRSLFTTMEGKRIVAFCDGHVELLSE